MYNGKLLWTGLTMIVALPILGVTHIAVIGAGAVIMCIGVILMWLDK